MIKHKEQRVGVLVDVSNMYHSAKNLYNRRVNFQQILTQAVASRKLIRATAYVIMRMKCLFLKLLVSRGSRLR